MRQRVRPAFVIAILLLSSSAAAQTVRPFEVRFLPTPPAAGVEKASKAGTTPRVSVPRQSDDEVIKVTGYVGLALDTFAATDLRKYLNPEDVGGVLERHMVGINFDYRIWQSTQGAQSVWLYGETINGVRSADVDCAADPAIPVCKDFADETNTSAFGLYALRNATSLEAFMGARVHLGEVNGDKPGASAEFYVKTQLGFLTVAHNGGDIVDMHHVGLGLMLTGADNPLRDSYLEIGYGRNDLFQENKRGRLKIDGFLSMAVGDNKNVRPFIQMTVDADGKSGADSIQVYLGIDLAVDKLFKK